MPSDLIGQKYESDIFFGCPKCGKDVRTAVTVPEPSWGDVESTSDIVTEGEATITCPACSEPFLAEVHNYGSGCDIKLIDYPDVGVQADMPFFSPPDPDLWTDETEAPPLHPHSIFLESYKVAWKLLFEMGIDNGNHLLNRMTFTHFLTAMEAHLCDTLINHIRSDKDALKALLAKDKTLREVKITLEEIEEDPNIVLTKVERYLRGIRYHNLPMVDFLYRTALDAPILTDKATNTQLLRAVQYRHDCVHRNGFDREGNRLEVFTVDYVQRIARLIDTLVTRVEAAYARQTFDTLPF